MDVDWIVFDLGETLVDETSMWSSWADYLGITRLTFFALLGSVITERRSHRDVFELVRPGFDFPTEAAAKVAAGFEWTLSEADLYPDAIDALHALKHAGHQLAVMANQPLEAQPFMASLPVDLVATSAGWGVAKPDPAFFAQVASAVGAPPERIAYVGDRVDNDVVPARAAGMTAVHIRRGPWGFIHAGWPEAEQADLRIDSLLELRRG